MNERQYQNNPTDNRESFDNNPSSPLMVLAELSALRDFIPHELRNSFDEAVKKYVKEKGINISKDARKASFIQKVSRCIGRIVQKK